MTKTPRIQPRSTGALPSLAGAPAAPPVDAEAESNPFASLVGDGDGDTKLYQAPRELIELARAIAERSSSAGTLTPIAPRPNAELEATLAAYTAGLGNPSGRANRPLLLSPVAPRGPDAPRSPDVPRSPVAPRSNSSAAARQAPATHTRSKPVSAPRSPGRPWWLYVGLCLILGYCVHLLLSS